MKYPGSPIGRLAGLLIAVLLGTGVSAWTLHKLTPPAPTAATLAAPTTLSAPAVDADRWLAQLKQGANARHQARPDQLGQRSLVAATAATLANPEAASWRARHLVEARRFELWAERIEHAGLLDQAGGRLRAAQSRVLPALHARAAGSPAQTLDATTSVILGNDALPLQRELLAAAPLPTVVPAQPSYQQAPAPAPEPGDLGDSVDAPLHPEVVAKAAELGFEYTRILDFVRGGIRTEWYPGAQRGALGCLRARAGNDVDQASLLIALLRASDVPARYMHGIVRVPLAEFEDNLNLQGSGDVLRALNRALRPHRPVLQGGVVQAIELELTWISAHLPFVNYRGSAATPSGRMWLPLAPAIKPHQARRAARVLALANIDTSALVLGFLQSDPGLSPMELLRVQVQQYLTANPAAGDYEDQLAQVRPIATDLELLPASLPFEVLAVRGEQADLPPELAARVHISVLSGGQELLARELTLIDASVNRLTLSFQPASADDQNLLNRLGGGLAEVPPYLFQLRPRLSLGGRILTVGNAVEAAAEVQLRVQLQVSGATRTVEQTLVAGGMAGILLDAGVPRPAEETGDAVLGDSEPPVSRVLGNLAARYAQDGREDSAEIADLLGVRLIQPLPTLVLTLTQMDVERVDGVPLSLTFDSVAIDAAARGLDVLSRGGHVEDEASWFALTGLQCSWLEHRVFEEQWAVPALSADRILARVALAGLPVLLLQGTDGQAQVAALAHPEGVKSAISAWLQRGHQVRVPASQINVGPWRGSAWQVLAADESVGYFLSGGLAGGVTVIPAAQWFLTGLAALLMDPYAAAPNLDPSAAYGIMLFDDSNAQIGTVGTELPLPLRARVVDPNGRPVVGASVQFEASGGGSLSANGVSGSIVSVVSNARGLVEARLRLPTHIESGRYVSEEPENPDVYPQFMGVIGVRVSASSQHNPAGIVAGTDYLAYARPGSANRIELFGPPQFQYPEGTLVVRTVPGVGYSTWSLTALDSFDNVVANAPITLATEFSPVFRNLPPDLQCSASSYAGALAGGAFLPGVCPDGEALLTGHACLRPNVQFRTRAGENLFHVAPHNVVGAELNVTISTPGAPDRLQILQNIGNFAVDPPFNTCRADRSALDVIIAHSVVHHDGDGHTAGEGDLVIPPDINEPGYVLTRDDTIEAARPGEWLSVPRQFTLFSENDPNTPSTNLLTTWTARLPGPYGSAVNPRLTMTASSGAEITDAVWRGGGSFEYNVRMPPEPGKVTLGARMQTLDGTLHFDFDFPAVWSVLPKVDAIVPTEIPLSPVSTVAADIFISNSLLPPEYQSGNVLHQVEKSGDVIASVPGSRMQGSRTFTLGRGWTYESDHTYSYKYSINEGTPYRIEAARFPLVSADDVIVGVGLHSGAQGSLSAGEATALALRGSAGLVLSQTLNVASGRSCGQSGELVFLLARRAQVRVDYHAMDEQGGVSALPSGALFEDLWFDAGTHRHPVGAELPIGRFQLRVKAVAENGADEELRTSLLHRLDRRDHLGLGHTVVADVDLFDGQVTVGRQDLAPLAGRGPAVELQRTWSSMQGDRLGIFGRGWGSNLAGELQRTACDLRVIGAQGAGTEFRLDGSEADGSLRYRALDGYHGTLYQRTDASYDVYAKDGTRYHYAGSQQYLHPFDGSRVIPLTFTEDTNGNRVTRAYQWLAGLPVLTEMRGSGGRTLNFDYEIKPTGALGTEPTAYPLLVRARGPGQFELLLEYDERAQLVRAYRTDAPQDETYAYQDFGWSAGSDQSLHRLGSRMRSARNEIPGRMSQSLDYDLQWVHSPRPNGDIHVHPELRVTHHYNALQQATGFEYQGLRGLGLPVNTAVTSPRALVTDYRMNGFGGVDLVADPIGTATTEWDLAHRQPSRQVDREGVVTEFDYDDHGNLLLESRSGRGEPVEQRYTWREPDEFAVPIKNRPASHSDFAGTGELYQYDTRGNRIARTRAGETESWTYTARGEISTWTDFEGAATSYTYSDSGLPQRVVHADSAVVRQEHDARGRVIRRIDEIGRVETYEYDGFDRMTRTEYADGNARRTEYLDAADTRIEFDELERPTTYLQDALGRTVRTTNALSDYQEMQYDAHGNVERERKFDGTETTHEYDDLDRRTRTTEALARITERDYDKVGNLLEVRAAVGPEVRTTRYQYQHARYARTRVAQLLGARELETLEARDGEGRLTGITDPLDRVTVIDLDGFGREIERREPLGRVSQRNLDGMGRLTSELVLFPGQVALTRAWTFDARGREASATDRAGGVAGRAYDAAGQLLQSTDPTGRITSFTYDARGRVASETRPGDGRVRSVTYDAVGNVLTETRPSQSQITHVYDELNRRRSSSDDLGTIEELDYDEEGRVTHRRDAIDVETTYDYDDLGRQIIERRPLNRHYTRTWTAHDELASETNPRTFTTSHEYDSLGRRISSTDPVGIQLWDYDDGGNIVRHEDRLQRATAFEYDALNRRVRQVDPAPLTTDLTWRYDALDRVVAETDRNDVETVLTLDGEGRELQRARAGRNELQTYDAAGRRISRTDAQGRITNFVYDLAGRLQEERRPLGAILHFEYGPADQLLSSTDADGIVIASEYDLRLRKVADSNPLDERTVFEWDPRGLRTAIVKPESPDHRWAFEFDDAGRLERVTDPLENETEYAYDRADNLTGVLNARDETTTHEYDELNRRTLTVHPGVIQETFTLDAEGNRRVWVRENNQRLEMDYDALNRLTETRRLPAAADGIERVARIYDGVGNLTRVDEFSASGPPRVWSATYDAFNRRIETTDRNGVSVQQRYDASDNRIERTGPEGRTQYSYNALDQLQAITPPESPPTAADVSAAGRLEALDHGNGTRTEVTRDNAGRVRQVKHLLGAAAMLTLGYTLDTNGNRTAEVWERGPEQIQIAYELDLAERLTAVTTNGERIQYTLDEHGNRTVEIVAGVTRIHSYDERDRLTETRENDQIVASYGYDDAGRQISHSAGGINRIFEYDTQDRLLAVTQNGAPLVRYESDAFGQRTLREAAGQVEQYQWDGTRLAGRTNATGSTLGDYQHAYGWAISSREGAIRSTLHTDVHGTPQLITDGTAAIAGWTRTDVWGVEKAQSGAQSRLGHTGYLKDPLLGDELYAQARQYRAGVGRFTSRDEWAGDNLSPITLNKYLYGNGNPGTFVDPDGRRGCETTACELAQLRSRMNTPAEIARVDARIDGYTQSMSKGLSRAAGVAVGLGELAVQGAVETASTAADTFVAPIELATQGAVDLGAATRNEERLAAVSSGIVDAVTEPDAVFVEPIRDVARLIGQGRDFEAGKRLAPYYAAASSPIAAGRSPSRLVESSNGGIATTAVVSGKRSPDLAGIDDLMIRFGRRALRESDGDFRASESRFDQYSAALNNRLDATGSPYRIESQPAALVGEGRVPNFINLFRGRRPDSPLISDAQGNPRLFAFPGSRRLDAGVFDLRDVPNEHGLRPIISGYDITLDQRKPRIEEYYREAFGDIPVADIRPPPQ